MSKKAEQVEDWVVLYVGVYYDKPDITLDEFASNYAMRTRTVQRCLKERGTSWRALLTEKRMAVAWKLLTKSTMPMADIAIAVGYSRTHNFVTQYKRKYNQLPSETRREAQKHGSR